MPPPQETREDASIRDAPFVPTVTAISSTPDFQWMVQPTIITSVSPCLGGKQANEPQSSHQATPKEGGSKGKNAGKKGKAEQVGALAFQTAPAIGHKALWRREFTYASLHPLCVQQFHCCRDATGAASLAASLPPALDLYSGHSKVCNNGLFLGALQRNMLFFSPLHFSRGWVGGGTLATELADYGG